MPPTPAERLALSTCWNSSRHTCGYAMLEEIRDLGFPSAELSHGVPSYLVEGILRAVEENWIDIVSVHNFCPLPSMAQGAAPNLFQPTGLSREEQTAWLRYSKKTIEFAVQVGAPHVVMHSGSMPFLFFPPKESSLESDEGNPGRTRTIKRLRRKAAKTMPRLEAAYRTLLESANESEVCLVAENREGLQELPLDEELPAFFERVDHPNLRYWHDTGHAELKQRLGLLDHDAHLNVMADHLAGFHLHDVSEKGRDHQVIGSGSIDFGMIASHIRPEHTLVVELSPRLSPEEVIQSRETLLSHLG